MSSSPRKRKRSAGMWIRTIVAMQRRPSRLWHEGRDWPSNEIGSSKDHGIIAHRSSLSPVTVLPKTLAIYRYLSLSRQQIGRRHCASTTNRAVDYLVHAAVFYCCLNHHGAAVCFVWLLLLLLLSPTPWWKWIVSPFFTVFHRLSPIFTVFHRFSPAVSPEVSPAVSFSSHGTRISV